MRYAYCAYVLYRAQWIITKLSWIGNRQAQRPGQGRSPISKEGSSMMDDDFEKRRSHLRAVTEFAGKTGPAWVEEFEPQLSKLPTGTVVAINCVTGEYVTGKGLSEASDAFEKRFGK